MNAVEVGGKPRAAGSVVPKHAQGDARKRLPTDDVEGCAVLEDAEWPTGLDAEEGRGECGDAEVAHGDGGGGAAGGEGRKKKQEGAARKCPPARHDDGLMI